MRPILFACALAVACLRIRAAEGQELPPPSATPTASPTPAPTRAPGALKQPSTRAEVERQRRSDATFMTRARLRGLEELELSRIAALKASNPDIHSLALRILDERGRADEALAQLAVSRGIDLAAALELGRQADVDRFSTLPANEIERAYLAALLRIHDPDVADSRNQSKMGQDVELHAWVYDNLPLLENQQEEIHRLASELGVPANRSR